MTGPGAAERRRRVLLAIGSAILGVVTAASLTTGGEPVGLAASTTLTDARHILAVCKVQADTAVTDDERGRAAACVQDMQRVIAALQPTPAPTTPPPTTAPPVAEKFPTATSVGVPEGWVPKSKRTGDVHLSAGAALEDVQVTDGTVYVDAPNVAIRRVQILGGYIDISTTACRGLAVGTGKVYPVIEDTSILSDGGGSDRDPPAISDGGYTARRVAIVDMAEGFRDGGADNGCGPVVVVDSYAKVSSPATCSDWHGDGMQGYGGPPLTITHTTLELDESGCSGNAPFFVPYGQGNSTVAVDGLLVRGGGFPFRLGVPGTVKGLRIVDQSWGYTPMDVRCSVVTAWEASIVRVDTSNAVTATVRAEPCQTEGGR